jgi:hypothetical protein
VTKLIRLGPDLGFAFLYPGDEMLARFLYPADVGACLCWAIDNNLTRKVSASDAVQVACAKGLVAGIVNLGIVGMLGFGLPGKRRSCAPLPSDFPATA